MNYDPAFEVKSIDLFGVLSCGVLLAYLPVPAFFYYRIYPIF